MYRTMTVAIVADITPRPLRTKADSVQKIVGYAGTGVMLVAISVMVPNVERPDYLPLFLLQAAFVLVSAVVYLVFLLMGVSLGGLDMCAYTMILECCSSNSVGRYSGYYYTVSMAAQVITPILSSVVMDVNPAMLFAYITAWVCSWTSPWPVPSTATPSSLTRLSAERRRQRPRRAGAGALAAGGRGSGQRT